EESRKALIEQDRGTQASKASKKTEIKNISDKQSITLEHTKRKMNSNKRKTLAAAAPAPSPAPAAEPVAEKAVEESKPAKEMKEKPVEKATEKSEEKAPAEAAAEQSK
ncbi:MAG: hypothetical protein PHU71_02745, partial [Candidatus Gracilibacteria bacterium]|nr:hypothetical protein [Candidatus Gracilibacteria bacterium]